MLMRYERNNVTAIISILFFTILVLDTKFMIKKNFSDDLQSIFITVFSNYYVHKENGNRLLISDTDLLSNILL